MKLSGLADRLRKYGLTVVETPGWANRGFVGRDLIEVRGVLWHHTATNRQRYEGADAPTLQMCIDGRSDVAGPLCNIVFGRSGTVYLTAAGLANHAGAGSAPNIPTDYGNYYLIGIEMESSGIAPWDWTLDQLRIAPYLGAALELEYLGHLPESLRLQIGHLEYSSTGKIDPAGWPGGMDGLRASINSKLGELANGGAAVASLGGITHEEDTLSAAEVHQINVWTQGVGNKVIDQVWGTAEVLQKQNAQTAAKVDALIEALKQREAGDEFDFEKIEEAAATGAAKALEEGVVRVEYIAAPDKLEEQSNG